MNFLQWVGLAPGRTLAPGDVVPEVESRDEEGKQVRLRELCGDGFALVYFYPKADTPGCTKQACSLRDGFAELQDQGVRVIGVSSDSPTAQQRFKKKFRLPFTLLADEDHAVAEAFGVSMMIGLTRRQSFLIRNGRVVWRDLKASTRNQARDVLQVLASAK